MAILDKLAGLGGSVKNSLQRTFGDGDANSDETDDGVDANDSGNPAPALTVEAAWSILGLIATATLDDVRAAAQVLGRAHHPGYAAKDPAATAALARVADAADLLEEHLLPLVPGTPAGPKASSFGPPSTRLRATARKG